MPEPVPPAWPPVTEMVTTLGLALAATAVIWFTESVSFTTMFCALSALSLDAGASLAATSAVMPAPEAPPMSAAATIAAATPRPTRRGFGAGCRAAGCPAGAVGGTPATGAVGWVSPGRGPPNAGGTWPFRGWSERWPVRPRRALRMPRRCGGVVRLRGLAGLVDRARGRGAAGAAGVAGAAGAAGAAAAGSATGAVGAVSAAVAGRRLRDAAGVAGVAAWSRWSGSQAPRSWQRSRRRRPPGPPPWGRQWCRSWCAPSKAMPASRASLCAASAKSVIRLSPGGESSECG